MIPALDNEKEMETICIGAQELQNFSQIESIFFKTKPFTSLAIR